MPDARGLYGKFRVERVDGKDKKGGAKENAAYFVMDYANDPDAWVGVASWAVTAQHRRPVVARELAEELLRVWPGLVADQSKAAILNKLLDKPDGAAALESSFVYVLVARIAAGDKPEATADAGSSTDNPPSAGQ